MPEPSLKNIFICLFTTIQCSLIFILFMMLNIHIERISLAELKIEAQTRQIDHLTTSMIDNNNEIIGRVEDINETFLNVFSMVDKEMLQQGSRIVKLEKNKSKKK